jgi:hypothetical protein
MGLQQIQGGQQIEFNVKEIAIPVAWGTQQLQVYAVESVNGKTENPNLLTSLNLLGSERMNRSEKHADPLAHRLASAFQRKREGPCQTDFSLFLRTPQSCWLSA